MLSGAAVCGVDSVLLMSIKHLGGGGRGERCGGGKVDADEVERKGASRVRVPEFR